MTSQLLGQELMDLFDRVGEELDPRELADIVSSALLARTPHSSGASVGRAIARGLPARAPLTTGSQRIKRLLGVPRK